MRTPATSPRGSAGPAGPRWRRLFAVLGLLVLALPAFAQEPTHFDPSRDLEGFEAASASDHSDLYPLRRYLDMAGRDLSADDLAKIREQWKIDRAGAEKRLEAVLTDPREGYLRELQKRLAAHPFFSKVECDVDRSNEDLFFLVQRARPGGSPLDPKKVASFYGGAMNRMREAFTKDFARPLGIARRADYPAYTVLILADEDEYHAFADTIEQRWKLAEAYYDPKLALIVAYGNPTATETTAGRQRRLVLSEFARALEHAHFTGRADRPLSLWLNLGFASWFCWKEGVLAESADKTAADPDLLADLVRISQDKTLRGLVLHPLLDLVQVSYTADIGLLAKNRAETAGVAAPPVEDALKAFYDQSFLWIHFLQDGANGRYREPFQKFLQASLSGQGGLDAFYLAFHGLDLAQVDKEFWVDVFAEHERKFPKVRVDRSFSDAPFADRAVERKAPAASARASTPIPASLPAPAPYAPSAVAVTPADIDGAHGLALLQALHGDLDGALENLEKILPFATEAPESVRIPREIQRVRQFRMLREGYFDYLVKTGEKISGRYRGMDYVAPVQKVEDGWIFLGDNASGLSKIPVSALEAFEIARQAGRPEEQGKAEPWVRFWPYVLVGEKKWEQLLKDDSEGAKTLREDAAGSYVELLKCAKAATALNEIAATPEPKNAKDAEKLLASVKSLLASYADLPLVLRKKEALRKAMGSVILKTYTEPDPAKLCHGTWTTGSNGVATVVYDFTKPDEAKDFVRVDDYLSGYHKSLSPTVKKEADSNWAVAGGEFAGSGSACYRHFADFLAPVTVRYDVTFRSSTTKGGGAFTFMVGACDDAKGSYVACLNFGDLTVTDLDEHLFQTLSDEKPAVSKRAFKLEIRNDGTNASSWIAGVKKYETPCGRLRNGGVFLWFHTDNVVSIQKLEIEGKLDPAWPDRAKAAFFQAKLAELGFK